MKSVYAMLFTGLVCKAFAIHPWKNDDQVAYEYFSHQSFAQAKHGFHDKAWKASSAFRDQDYDMALKYYQEITTTDGFYNLGNTYAAKGDIKAAMAAYEHALNLDPTHQDAKHNLDVLKKYQDKQKQDKQKQDKQKQDKQKQDKQKQDKQKQDKQKQDKQKQDKQKQDKQKQAARSKRTEKGEAKEDWMKFIQEDAAGLLREKFRRDYQRAQEEGSI